MKSWLIFLLACVISNAFAAQEVQLGCKRLRVVLDPRLSVEVVERDWGSGRAHSEAPAKLELVGCKGKVLDRLTLAAPLAKLDPVPLRGASGPSYLVSADLTAEAGSYNGPLTIPIQVVGDQLVPAVALSAGNRSEPVRLSLTGKSAWRRLPGRKFDELLFVSCQPKDTGFATTYGRYIPLQRGWLVRTYTRDGVWESDGGFPSEKLFP